MWGAALACSLVAGLWGTQARAHELHDQLGHAIEHEHEDEDAGQSPEAGHDHRGEGFDRYERGEAAAGDRAGEGRRSHDGFYLHLALGAGALNASNDTGLFEAKVYGGGAALNIEVGLAVRENLVVFGKLGGISVVDPSVEVTGLGWGTARGERLNLSLLGVGAGWYFSSINLFVAGAISAAALATETADGQQLSRTDVGAAVSLSVGKEWWISPNWGLGVALELIGGRVPDEAGSASLDPWRIGGAAVSFSATFN